MTTAQCISQTNFVFPGLTSVYHGKVRDVYEIEGKYLVMVASDRISAFDFILSRHIPYKGQVLNQIAAKFLEMSKDIVPNWILSIPDPNVAIGIKCEPIKIEMVIRGYLSGHAWRIYKSGGRMICGVKMPNGMKENDAFPEAIITPATKASEGHDEDISKEEIISKGILSESEYLKLESYTRKLFKMGSDYASTKGLILVDTKYEFGYYNGQIYLMDEIHTPDSSRYFFKETYSDFQKKGVKQRHLSKEFIREWLMENNFQGLKGQSMPEMDDDIVEKVSARYLELYAILTGDELEIGSEVDVLNRIESNILRALTELKKT